MIDVLAVGPHPDDVELAAGGTVALLTSAGRSVLLLDLTAGERATRGSVQERAREAAEAARLLGGSRECLGLPDAGLDARDPGQVAALVAAIRRLRPRLLLALHRNDDHPDHREGAELVARAVYLSGLRRYPEPETESTAHRPRRVLYAMGRRPFAPSLVVDVSAVYEKKRLALAAYRSQFHRDPGDPRITPISDPEFLARVEARDRYFGGWIGAAQGEPFFQEGPVPILDTDGLFLGGER
jgi:bacillithiol biosynthesis deacetylase BshB1